MLKGIAFREALLWSIDRELIAETIISGFGGIIYGGGHGAGVAFHQTDPEWKDKWALGYDPDFARSRMADAGVDDGFGLEFYCPSGCGTLPDVGHATAGRASAVRGMHTVCHTSRLSCPRATPF